MADRSDRQPRRRQHLHRPTSRRRMERPQLIPTAIALVAAGLLAGCGITDPDRPAAPAATPTAAKAASSSSTTTAADAGDPPAERNGHVPAAATAAETRLPAGAATEHPTRSGDPATRGLYINWTAAQADRRPTPPRADLDRRRPVTGPAGRCDGLNRHPARPKPRLEHRAGDQRPARGRSRGRPVGDRDLRENARQRRLQGLPAQLHVTYAVVTDTSQGWVISQWAPQN